MEGNDTSPRTIWPVQEHSKGIGMAQVISSKEQTLYPTREVTPDVWRITLPLPFALRSVNVYLLHEGDEWCLIDAGLRTRATEAALRAGFEEVGLRLRDVRTILLTHAHPDHIGLAGVLEVESGAQVLMFGPEAEQMWRVWGDEDYESFRATARMFFHHGMPVEEARFSAEEAARSAQVVALPRRITPLHDGQKITLPGGRYQVIWTPGHADGHICLYRASDGLLIAGDHVLPHITPNIGLYPASRLDPLGDYLNALTKVERFPSRLVLPGHGDTFTDLSGRVAQLREHHAQRENQLLELLSGRPTTAYALAEALFGHRFDTVGNRRFALAETLAHLEHLHHNHRVEPVHGSDMVRYRALAA
jgi:glyoxylase-like metal-dependent hydrolase (beta-lactamase superfamily II)